MKQREKKGRIYRKNKRKFYDNILVEGMSITNGKTKEREGNKERLKETNWSDWLK